MSRRGVIGAGNWILDRIKLIDRWPEEGELCNITELAANVGGAGNALFDLAALDCGLELYAAGMIGDDDAGKTLLRAVREHGIHDDYLQVCPGISTSFTDVMSCNGRRTFFHHRGANARFGCAQLEEVTAPARLFYLAYLLLLDGLDQPDPEFGTAGARALARMRQRGCRTVVDIVSEAPAKFRRVVPPALRWIDDLVINELEAGNAAGLPVRRSDGTIDAAAIREAARRLLEQGVREAVIIHFPEGAFVADVRGAQVFAPSFRIGRSEIVCSVGAGDAFCSGVLYALHEGLDWPEALLLGGGCAHFNLRHATSTGGAPTLPELRRFVATAPTEPTPPGF